MQHPDDWTKSLVGKDASEVTWLTTTAMLATLPDRVEDMAYRAVLSHWFDAEILEVVDGSTPARAAAHRLTDGNETPEEAVVVLRELPFVEEYPEFRLTFHELTRSVMVDRLWHDEPAFCLGVSEAIANHLLSRGGLDDDEVVELIYHALQVDEPAATDLIESVFRHTAKTSVRERILAAVDELAGAHRLSDETNDLRRLWRLWLTYYAGDLDQAKHLAEEMRADAELSPPLQRGAIVWLARILRRQGQPDKAADLLVGLEGDGDAEDDIRIEAMSERADLMAYGGDAATARQLYQQAILRAAIGYERDETDLDLLDPNVWFSADDLLIALVEADESETPTAEEPESGTPDESDGMVVDETVYYVIARPEHEPAEEEEMLSFGAITVDETVAELWLGLGRLDYELGHFDEASVELRLAGSIYATLGDTESVATVVSLLHHMGADTGDMELVEEALEVQEGILERARLEEDANVIFGALIGLAESHERHGNVDDARRLLEEAAGLAQAAGDSVGEATAHEALADLLLDEEQVAERHIERAVDLFTEAGSEEGVARMRMTQGDAVRAHGRMDEAIPLYQAALAHYERARHPRGETGALRGLGLAARERGDLIEAERYFTEALSRAKLAGTSEVMRTTVDLAELAAAREDWAGADRLFSKARTLAKRGQLWRQLADSSARLGSAAASGKEWARAAKHYAEAEELYAELGDSAGLLTALQGQYDAEHDRGDTGSALAAARRWLSVAEEKGTVSDRTSALVAVGNALVAAGSPGDAIHLSSRALELEEDDPWVLANLGWVLLRAGRYEASIEASNKALAGDESLSWVWPHLGHAHLALGNAKEADTAYRTAIETRPEDRDFTETIEEIEWVLERHPDAPSGDELRALVLRAQQELAAED